MALVAFVVGALAPFALQVLLWRIYGTTRADVIAMLHVWALQSPKTAWLAKGRGWGAAHHDHYYRKLTAEIRWHRLRGDE